MSEVETQSETLWVRCTPSLKRRLQELAARSVAKDVSDHVRFALEEYLDAHAPAVDSERATEALPT